MRDTQKRRVYDAEDEAGFKMFDERELETLQDCEAFLHQTLQNPWVRMDFGSAVCEQIDRQVKVIATRRRTWCRVSIFIFYKIIQMPYRNWAWNRTTLLHELAHIVTGSLWEPQRQDETGRFLQPIASHEPEWCWVFLRLLRHCGVPNEWAMMKRLFELHKVRFYYWKSPLMKDKLAATKEGAPTL